MTGSIPNQDMVPNDRRFPIQDGIPRSGGDSDNGNGHRTQVLLGDPKPFPLSDGLRDLRLHFFVFGDRDTDMGCREQVQNIGSNMPYVPPCRTPVPKESACNQCFGMNFQFNLPAPRPNFKIFSESAKYNAINIGNRRGAQLQIPFGTSVAKGDEEDPTPTTAYLRITSAPNLPPDSFHVFPPENTYFTVTPGSDQDGLLTIDVPSSLPSDFSGEFIITVRTADNTDIPPAQRDLQADDLLLENWISLRSPTLCDVNSDGVVNVDDIGEIFTFRGLTVTAPHRYDVDGDGVATVNDARSCSLRCTNQHCTR